VEQSSFGACRNDSFVDEVQKIDLLMFGREQVLRFTTTTKGMRELATEGLIVFY
jgi:hypothetical protein